MLLALEPGLLFDARLQRLGEPPLVRLGELRDRFAMILRDLEIRFRQLLPPGSANKIAQ